MARRPKQSSPPSRAGGGSQSLSSARVRATRWLAMNNDDERNADALCRRFCCRGPEEEARCLSQHSEKGRQDLARAWRAGLPRMGGGGREGRQAHVVSAQRESQARRDRDLL